MRRALAAAAFAVPVVAVLLRRRTHVRAYARALLARARPTPPGIIFTGTGCSSTLPLVRCAIDGSAACACAVAVRNGRSDPNWRGNVGAVLRFIGADGTARHVQIDVGKSWREAAVRWFPRHRIRRIDGVLLTHEHADASLGLDDLRSLQIYSLPGTASSAIPVFADLRSLKKIRNAFPYLFPPPPRLPPDSEGDSLPGAFALMCACCEEEPASAGTGDVHAPDAASPALSDSHAAPAATPAAPLATPAPAAVPAVVRFVAKLDWRCFGADVSAGPATMHSRASTLPFEVAGLRVTPLPVMHGEDYVSYGFGVGEAGGRLVYISDYTRLLPQTVELLERWSAPGDGISLLVLDALSIGEPSPVHATVAESIALARKLAPARTLLVGMGHGLEHRACNAQLARLLTPEGIDLQLARDGQFVPLPALLAAAVAAAAGQPAGRVGITGAIKAGS